MMRVPTWASISIRANGTNPRSRLPLSLPNLMTRSRIISLPRLLALKNQLRPKRLMFRLNLPRLANPTRWGRAPLSPPTPTCQMSRVVSPLRPLGVKNQVRWPMPRQSPPSLSGSRPKLPSNPSTPPIPIRINLTTPSSSSSPTPVNPGGRGDGGYNFTTQPGGLDKPAESANN